MKIHTLVFTTLFLFLTVIGVMSAGFYAYERKAVLGYMTNGVQQSVFHLEEDIKRVLQTEGQRYEVQSILDRASAIDLAIDEVSISLDGKTIAFSSQRTQINKPATRKYNLLRHMNGANVNIAVACYKSEFEYFDGDRARQAILFIEMDQDYVYGELDRLAWMFGAGLSLLMIGVVSLAFVTGQRFFLYPLRKIGLMVQMKNQEADQYFIKEFSVLSETIAGVFRTMWLQDEELKESLNESRYLDGVLRMVADVNGYLISSKDVNELSQKCCERLSTHAQYGICWIGIFGDNQMEVTGCTEKFDGLLYQGFVVNLYHSEELFAYAPSIQAFQEDSIVSLKHLEKNESLAAWNFIAHEKKNGSFIALPLRASKGEKPFGVLSLYGSMQDGFLPKEVQMLEDLAGDIGFAIHSYRQKDQLTYHLQVDTVTGLANRISLIDALTDLNMCGLAIVNIDRFSDINDVYGVAIGDQVLAGYGRWLTQKVKKVSGIVLYKLGSDEYALLFDEKVDTEDSIAFLEDLIDQTAEASFLTEGIEIVLTITVGFDPKSTKVLENATRALKQAKIEHKSLLIFTPAMGAKKEQEKNIEWYKEIKESLQEGRIVPYYQPIVDTKTHEIVKYEALIRLIKRDGTIVSPFHFLEIAQKIRLYTSLTKVMIDKVLERFEGLEMKVSINLSNEDIINVELADYLEEVILHRKMGQFVIFEILESEGITNYTEVSTFIERFRCLGCSFAIDDFGAGYSNFDHILKLNIDTLKIDASLIKNLPHDHNSQIIVRHICEFAREMGMQTVAEFVANEAIYQKVLELGIDTAQGYYFYEPSETLQH